MAIVCIRCGGLLVRERIFEANGMSSTERVDCERCLNCGAVEDDVIRANRQLAGSPFLKREPRGPRVQQRDVTTLMRGSTDTHRSASSPTIEPPYRPPARADYSHGNRAYGRHLEHDAATGTSHRYPASEGAA